MPYIMIIDDDDDFASAAARVLRRAGHEVDTKASPVAAMKEMGSRRPDLVILDVMFPEDCSAGIELARAMRTNTGSLHDVPVLMLSAVSRMHQLRAPDRSVAAPLAGAYLEKPVDFDELLRGVTALLNPPPPPQTSAPEHHAPGPG